MKKNKEVKNKKILIVIYYNYFINNFNLIDFINIFNFFKYIQKKE